MATNIPPHNLGEVIDATIHLIDHPEATARGPDAVRQGPRLPDRGATSWAAQGIMDAYRTGRGSIRMRARAEIVESRTGDADRRHRAALPGQPEGDPGAGSPSWSTPGSSTASADLDDLSAGRRHQAGHRPQARRQRQRGAQQPVQAHPAADQLRGQHGGPGRRGAPHPQPGPGPAGLRRPPGRGHPPAVRVPPAQGPGPGPHRRGPDQGARHDRRHHRRHPGVGRPGRGPDRR